MNDKWILRDGIPERSTDALEWAGWFETADRTVARTEMGDVLVSTVFLGLDHSFGKGVPILWETLVFGGKLDGEMDRYTTREAAEKGHARMVSRVKEEQ